MTTQTIPTLYHAKGTNQTATDRRHLAEQLRKVYGERVSLEFGSRGTDKYFVDVYDEHNVWITRREILAR